MFHLSAHKQTLTILLLIITIKLSLAYPAETDKIISKQAQIKLFPEIQKIEVIDTIKVITKGEKNRLILKLNPTFKIDNILVENKKAKYNQYREVVEIEGNYKHETEVILYYNGFFKLRTEFSELDKKNAYLRDLDIFPVGTKSYKFIRLTVQSPVDWDVIALGEKQLEVVAEDNKITIFETREKVETIGWIVAGRYFINSYKNVNIEISTHFQKERKALNDSIVELTQKVIDFFSTHFSGYRFPKLALVEVDDWIAGHTVLAAAYPSVILFKSRTFDTADKHNHILSILPHEIAHQWWPITNHVEENDVAFLSEGLCEYSSVLFKENMLTTPTNFNQHPLLRSLIQKSQKGIDIPLNKRIDLRAAPTHYLKASYIHHMLRFIIGDSKYLTLLKCYATDYALQVSNIKMFEKLAEDVSGMKLDWFFNQWITKTGIPRFKIYNVKTEILTDTLWRTKGRIRQISYELLHTTPFEIAVKNNQHVDKKIFWIGKDENHKYKNETEFVFHTSFKPEEVILDPDGYILKWQKLPPRFSDLRDPADGFMIVGTKCDTQRYSQLLQLARNDSIEMTKAGWDIKILDDTSTTLKHLQIGKVFIYGNTIENIVVNEQEKHFPIKPKLNNVIIDGVSYGDSLALIQIIDNPYLEGGLMCWIFPFSENSQPVLLPYNVSYAVLNKSEIITKGDWQIKEDELRYIIK